MDRWASGLCRLTVNQVPSGRRRFKSYPIHQILEALTIGSGPLFDISESRCGSVWSATSFGS